MRFCRFLVILNIFLTVAPVLSWAQGVTPESDRAVLGEKCGYYAPHGGRWMPESKDVDEAMNGIREFLANAQEYEEYAPPLRAAMVKIKDGFAAYRVQIVGITVDGKRRIHCNFLSARGSTDDWRENYFLVEDGGYDFWRIDYDLYSKKCVNFESNGPLF